MRYDYGTELSTVQHISLFFSWKLKEMQRKGKPKKQWKKKKKRKTRLSAVKRASLLGDPTVHLETKMGPAGRVRPKRRFSVVPERGHLRLFLLLFGSMRPQTIKSFTSTSPPYDRFVGPHQALS